MNGRDQIDLLLTIASDVPMETDFGANGENWHTHLQSVRLHSAADGGGVAT